MLMRYHYGLGVGHVYAHSSASTNTYETNSLNLDAEEQDPVHSGDTLAADPQGESSDCDLDFSDDSEGSNEEDEVIDDEDIHMYEMYEA